LRADLSALLKQFLVAPPAAERINELLVFVYGPRYALRSQCNDPDRFLIRSSEMYAKMPFSGGAKANKSSLASAQSVSLQAWKNKPKTTFIIKVEER
jgi:hypothetical protein